MELRDLTSFVVLGEVLHFGRAALRLHITQSALSKQVRRLEASLGGSLFERGPSGVRLTGLGRALYPDACAVVRQSSRLVGRAREVQAGIAGTLRIGFGVACKDFVPALIARFRAQRPEVKIELSDLSTHHQIAGLGTGALDLGFCRLPAPHGWPALPVLRARFVAVLPGSYPADMTLPALAQRPLIVIRREPAPSFHDHLMNYLARAGLRVQETLPANDFPAAVALAAAGVGWAIVPSSTAIDPLYVRALPLDHPAAGWQIGLLRTPGAADPLIEAFWNEAATLAAHFDQ